MRFRRPLAALVWVAVAVGFVAFVRPRPTSAQVPTLPTLLTTTSTTTPPTTAPPTTTTTAPPEPTTEVTVPAPPPSPPETAPPFATLPSFPPPTFPSPLPGAPARRATTTTRPAPVTTLATQPAGSVTAAITGSFGIGVAAVLSVALVLSFLAARARTGGTPVTADQRRWRLIIGIACLTAAAIVGLVGYLKLSLEPAVNRQIPYLASAGMALVVLSAIGGSLLVAEQLRGDDRRLDDLEAAVEHLAAQLAPVIEAPARRADAEPAAAPAERAADDTQALSSGGRTRARRR